jgi:hypothetical protein
MSGTAPDGLPAPLAQVEWQNEVVDALLATVEAADVDWATDASGDPWVVEGQRRPRGIGFPHAMLMSLDAQRLDASSDDTDELWQLQCELTTFVAGSPRDQSGLMRRGREVGATVMEQLYANRSLRGAIDFAYVDSWTAFEMDGEETAESGFLIQWNAIKDATHPY